MVRGPFFLVKCAAEAFSFWLSEQRERTTEQRAREFARLKAIEQERAKARHGGHHKDSIQENFPELTGQARDLAAQRVGMSGFAGLQRWKIFHNCFC